MNDNQEFDSALEPMIRIFETIKSCKNVQPTQALYCEIMLNRAGTEVELIPIGSAMVRDDELGTETFDSLAVKFAALSNIVANWGSYPNRSPFRSSLSLGVGRKGKNHEDPEKTDNEPAATLVVLKLGGRLNWQFSRDGDPFTAEPPPKGKSQPICGAERVDGADVLGKGWMDCFTAKFLVDARKITKPSVGTRKGVMFNIHIEFLRTGKLGEPDTFIPVIIDPDVGYPGGNGGRPK